MWQEAAEEEMSVTEAYMKRMVESKRVSSRQIVYIIAMGRWGYICKLSKSRFQIALLSNSMEKATQMWVDAATDEEGSKGDAKCESLREPAPATVEKVVGSVETISYSGPLKLTPLAGGARTPSGSAVAAFKPLTPGFTPTGSLSGRRKRPAALGASSVSPAALSSGASPSLSAVGTYYTRTSICSSISSQLRYFSYTGIGYVFNILFTLMPVLHSIFW